ncbi:MAG: DNA double-strand break repair nuclease NurA [archaeon]
MQGRNEILEIVELIEKTTKRNQVIVNEIKKTDLRKKKNPYNQEEMIIEKINPLPSNNLKIAGVDSGFCSKALNFGSITIIKEVGVIFSYKDNKLSSTKYFPLAYNLAKPYLTTSALEIEEVLYNTSILRLNKELSLASEILGHSKTKTDLDFLLLDGSIIPQYITRPGKESKLYDDYNYLLNKFFNLYDLARERKVFLVGVIEDCRADRFFNFINNEEIIEKKVDNVIYDSNLISSLLLKGERTGIMLYSKKSKDHPILRDFPEDITKNLYVVYLKVSDFDYPLRLEFIYFPEYGLSLKEYTEKIVSTLSLVSSHNKQYVYPAPLVEADIRSRLKENEIERIMTNIFERTKIFGLRGQRREGRMF